MTIVGLDLSVARTGIAFWRPGAEPFGLVRTQSLSWAGDAHESQGMARLRWYRDEIESRVKYGPMEGALSGAHTHSMVGIDLAVIEGYSFGAKGAGVYQLAELGGAIRLMLHERGIPFAVVPPAVLKKFVTGNGIAAKDQMRLEMFKRFGIEALTNDEIDAAGLALMGAYALGRLDAEKLTKPQQAALKGATWPTH
jgi:hypothetical protein